MNKSTTSSEFEDSGFDDEPNSDGAALNDEEVLVCPACFHPIDPNAHLCVHCGAPVSDRAMFDPFASIWGQGYSYRQITDHKARPNRVALIGVWLIFGPSAVANMIFLLIMLKALLERLTGHSPSISLEPDSLSNYVWGIILMSLFLFIQAAILVRVTQNYVRAREIDDREEEETAE